MTISLRYEVGTTASHTSHTANFGFTAVAGRTLVLLAGTPHSTYSLNNTPSGWVRQHTGQGGTRTFGSAVYWKISDGTETSVTYTTSNSMVSRWIILEIDGLETTSVLSADVDNESYINTSTTSVSTGTTGTLGTSSSYALAVFVADTGTGWDGGRSYANGSTEIVFTGAGSTNNGCWMAGREVSGTSGVSETCTTTDTGDEAWGCMLVFKQASGGAVQFDTQPTTQEAQVGVAFSYDLSALVSGTATPFAYALDSGTLPAGLSLNSSTGVITGTPTTAGLSSALAVEVTDDDANVAVSQAFHIDVLPATVWTESTLVSGASISGARQRAAMGGGKLFVGVIVKSDGTVRVYQLDGSTWTNTTLRTLSPANYHNNPSVFVASSGHVYAASVDHGSTGDLNLYKSASTYSIDFGSAVSVASGGEALYYPSLAEYDGKLWLFCNRGANRDIAYKTSSDGGATWDSSWTMVFDGDASQRPYFYLSEVDGELILFTTRTNPDDVSYGNSDGYFLRYDGTDWMDAAGTAYTLPVTTATGDVAFDSSAASANCGFITEIVKDGSGRFVGYVLGSTSANDRKLYMIRYDSGWSQTEVVHPLGQIKSSAVIDPSDAYAFHSIADYGGDNQVFRASSANSGATWTFVRYTDGAPAAYPRSQINRIRGASGDPHLLWTEQTITSESTWSSNVRAAFSELPALPTLTGIAVGNLTASGATLTITAS